MQNERLRLKQMIIHYKIMYGHKTKLKNEMNTSNISWAEYANESELHVSEKYLLFNQVRTTLLCLSHATGLANAYLFD